MSMEQPSIRRAYEDFRVREAELGLSEQGELPPAIEQLDPAIEIQQNPRFRRRHPDIAVVKWMAQLRDPNHR
jgi:hypothetical protein